MKYCRPHRTHVCPCVAPKGFYRKGDKRGLVETWDAAEEKYRAKQAARRGE